MVHPAPLRVEVEALEEALARLEVVAGALRPPWKAKGAERRWDRSLTALNFLRVLGS